ncbi:putative IL-18-binding protein [Equine molluscum contagiosum-like virus]|nr:putative IL-18-binding protein [Equine molluscum contagiosum-like virus]
MGEGTNAVFASFHASAIMLRLYERRECGATTLLRNRIVALLLVSAVYAMLAAVGAASKTEAATAPPMQCPNLTVTVSNGNTTNVTHPGDKVKVPLNGTLTLSCTACSRFHHFSILYWLGNGSFIEHLPGRLREGTTTKNRTGGRSDLRKDLEVDGPVGPTNVTCSLTDNSGGYTFDLGLE